MWICPLRSCSGARVLTLFKFSKRNSEPKVVAQLCAMAEFNPGKNPRDAWNQNQDRIQGLVEETLSRISGPSGCKKHYEVVLDQVKNYFFSSFSESFWMPDRVDDAVTRKTPQSEAFWRNISVPCLVDGQVEGFVMLERKRLWEAHKAIVISTLQIALPASARQFEAYYTEFFLPKFVFRKFDAGFPEGRSTDELEEWLKQLVKEVVATEIPKLINDNGELLDEQLVQLATSHEDEARIQLMERYLPKIRKTVAGIVYTQHVCPPSKDAASFIEDTAQNVCLKIMANLGSYGFEQPFKFWVRAICNNEALAERREEVGRKEVGGKPVPRVYISWEELVEYGSSPVIEENTERAELLKKIIDKYIKQGRRAKKSWRAIRLKWFEELEVEEIAEKLNTSKDYVYQMFSHDYPELRRISIDDFGLSGTDL